MDKVKEIYSTKNEVMETWTKVVHKNASQGCNEVRRSSSKIIAKLLKSIKVAFQVIYNLMKNFCLHDHSIHTKLHQNQSINECA